MLFVTCRVMYINGFKQIRSFLAENVRPSEYEHSGWVRLGSAMVPGYKIIFLSFIQSLLHILFLDNICLFVRKTFCHEFFSGCDTESYVPSTFSEKIFLWCSSFFKFMLGKIGINLASKACRIHWMLNNRDYINCLPY